MPELEFLIFVLIVSLLYFQGYRHYRKKQRLEREEAERQLKRDLEKQHKREEEKRLKREEEQRLEQEEAELKQSEFENSPAGRLHKAIDISKKYELFKFISKICMHGITETDAIRKADQDRLAIKAAGIKYVHKVISFTFSGFHYSIVRVRRSRHEKTETCYLLVDGKVVVEIQIFTGEYEAFFWIEDLPNSVKVLKLDAWLEHIPKFLKAQERAIADQKMARELEQKRKDEEALKQNVSLGKFDKSE